LPPMKHPLLLLLLLAAPCMAASTTGVDALSPADVSKAMDALKKTYASPISATELERDTLQGALDRMAPQVALLSGTDAAPAGCPFYSEDFNGTGYLRPGLLNAEAAARTAGVLKDWSGKSVAAVGRLPAAILTRRWHSSRSFLRKARRCLPSARPRPVP